MNEPVREILRRSRTALQILVDPPDRLVRWLNSKKGYPPLWIRQKVGSLNDFEGSGGEYMAYLKLLCDLESGMNVLDIGCGCGLMCLPINENPTLPECIYPGTYIGVDINRRMIDWCRKHIRGTYIGFEWLPIGSPNELPFKNEVFDVILCKSLFTHLFKHEVEHYLGGIKRLLRPRGRCLSTFFLLNEEVPTGRYTFKEYEGDFSLERKSKPRAAVAYNEDWLLPKLKELGFSYEIHYGSWRGGNKGLSFQDIIILRR